VISNFGKTFVGNLEEIEEEDDRRYPSQIHNMYTQNFNKSYYNTFKRKKQNKLMVSSALAYT